MLKPIKSNNSPGHTHNGLTSVVGLSTNFCPGNHLTKSNKMKHIIKSQFVLCFLTKEDVLIDAKLESFGVDTKTKETFTLEVCGIFDTKFEALHELQTHETSDVEFTIIEKLQVVKDSK
mgnify:FL=1